MASQYTKNYWNKYRASLPYALKLRKYAGAVEFSGMTFAVKNQAYRYTAIVFYDKKKNDYDVIWRFVKIRTKVLPRRKHTVPADAYEIYRSNRLLISPPYDPWDYVGEIKIGMDGYPWRSYIQKTPRELAMSDTMSEFGEAYWSRLRI